jgi:hypothetical protein
MVWIGDVIIRGAALAGASFAFACSICPAGSYAETGAVFKRTACMCQRPDNLFWLQRYSGVSVQGQDMTRSKFCLKRGLQSHDKQKDKEGWVDRRQLQSHPIEPEISCL